PTSTEVIKTETARMTPTIPIMPIVIARPCQNARAVVLQILLSERSMTEKTHDPAQKTITMQLMITPVLSEERERTVSRRNLAEAGYTSTIRLNISFPAAVRLLSPSISSKAGNNAIKPK